MHKYTPEMKSELNHYYYQIEMYAEIGFVFFMVRTFFTTYTPEGSTK